MKGSLFSVAGFHFCDDLYVYYKIKPGHRMCAGQWKIRDGKVFKVKFNTEIELDDDVQDAYRQYVETMMFTDREEECSPSLTKEPQEAVTQTERNVTSG